MLFLSADDCRRVLGAAAVLEGVENALRMERAGTVRWSGPRSMVVGGGERGSRVRVKGCALEAAGVAGVRVLVFPHENPDTRWVLLFDDATGRPLAIVDESWTYRHRSIASIALLAHRLRCSRVRRVGLIGAGRIARAALPYVRHLFPGTQLAVSSRREETRSSLVARARKRFDIDAVAVPLEEAVRGAQVVLGCTNATSAILRDEWVSPGAVVGSLEPRECEPELFARADLRVADSVEQLRDELTEAFGVGAPERVEASMADVITGVHPGRTDEGQRILVLSQGLVSQDVLLAARAYVEASARGIGVSLPIDEAAPAR